MTEDKPISLRSQSVFAPYIKDFVQQKQSLGLKYNVAIETLNMFDSFCAERNVAVPAMTDEIYSEWCRKRPAESETTHQIRVGYTRQFSKFLYNNGIEATAVFHPLPKRSKAFVPYIFSEGEMDFCTYRSPSMRSSGSAMYWLSARRNRSFRMVSSTWGVAHLVSFLNLLLHCQITRRYLSLE